MTGRRVILSNFNQSIGYMQYEVFITLHLISLVIDPGFASSRREDAIEHAQFEIIRMLSLGQT